MHKGIILKDQGFYSSEQKQLPKVNYSPQYVSPDYGQNTPSLVYLHNPDSSISRECVNFRL